MSTNKLEKETKELQFLKQNRLIICAALGAGSYLGATLFTPYSVGFGVGIAGGAYYFTSDQEIAFYMGEVLFKDMDPRLQLASYVLGSGLAGVAVEYILNQ